MRISMVVCFGVLVCATDVSAQLRFSAWEAPAATPVRGQASPAPASSPDLADLQLFAGALGGSLAGVGAGFVLGATVFRGEFACCDGDDPGLLAGVIGALAGSTLLSAAGAALLSPPARPVSYRSALLGSAVGIVPGIAGAYVGGRLGDGFGFVVGYSVGQAVGTTYFSSRRPGP